MGQGTGRERVLPKADLVGPPSAPYFTDSALTALPQSGPQYVGVLGEPGGHRAGIVAGAQIY